MNKVWLVIKREYLTRVKKMSFIVTTLLVPIGMIVMMGIMGLIASNSKNEKSIAVIDESAWFKNNLESSNSLKFSVKNDNYEDYKSKFQEEDFDGILYIPSIELHDVKGIEYYSSNQLGIATKSGIQNQIDNIIEEKRVLESGYDKEVISGLKSNVTIKNTIIKDGGEEKSVNAEVSTMLGMLMGFLIYTTLLVYGAMVMKGVMEEKTNRIVEVMISSVKPFQLMLGKIVGIGAVGLTQFLLWGIVMGILYPILILIFADQIMELQNLQELQTMQPNMGGIDPDKLEMAEMLEGVMNLPWLKLGVSFVFYFFGGYLLYSSLFAAVGSAMDEDSESQTLTLPIMLPIVVSIFIMMMTIENPHSPIAVWGSIIPFSSPIVMLARIPFDVPLWQLILSIVLLITGFICTTWIAGRIYRTGILMYGKKVSLKDIGKWMFSKN